jgi:hypothetical protein
VQDRAKSRRSAAVVAIELRRGQGSFDAGLEALGDRVLEHAEAVTVDISAMAPTVERRTRPADAVYGRLVQQRAALGGLDSNPDLERLEATFVRVAKTYSDRKGISHQTWRDVGVPADVLKRAGVDR